MAAAQRTTDDHPAKPWSNAVDPRAQAQGLSDVEAARDAYRNLQGILATLPDGFDPKRQKGELKRLQAAVETCARCGDWLKVFFAIPLDRFLEDGKPHPNWREAWRMADPNEPGKIVDISDCVYVSGGIPVGTIERPYKLEAFWVEDWFRFLLRRDLNGPVESRAVALEEMASRAREVLERLPAPDDLRSEINRYWTVVAPPVSAGLPIANAPSSRATEPTEGASVYVVTALGPRRCRVTFNGKHVDLSANHSDVVLAWCNNVVARVSNRSVVTRDLKNKLKLPAPDCRGSHGRNGGSYAPPAGVTFTLSD